MKNVFHKSNKQNLSLYDTMILKNFNRQHLNNAVILTKDISKRENLTQRRWHFHNWYR